MGTIVGVALGLLTGRYPGRWSALVVLRDAGRPAESRSVVIGVMPSLGFVALLTVVFVIGLALTAGGVDPPTVLNRFREGGIRTRDTQRRPRY